MEVPCPMIPYRASPRTTNNRHTARPRIPGGLRSRQARKADLVDLGAWAIHTSRGWLLAAVEVAIAREGQSHV